MSHESAPDLSRRALELLATLFSEGSNLQLPIGLAAQVVEIRAWVAAQIAMRERGEQA